MTYAGAIAAPRIGAFGTASRRRFWGTVLSVLAHGVVFGALLWSPVAPSPSLPSTVELSMPIPTIEPADATITPDTVTTAVEPQEVVRERQPETVQAPKVPPPETTESPPEEAPPVATTEAPPEVEVIESRAVEAPLPAPPPPRPRPAPRPAPRVEAPPAEAPPVAPPPPASAPAPSPAPVAPRAAEAPAAGTAGPPPDYLSALRAWLEKHKEYPQLAQRRRQQGTALLRFTLLRDGRVIAHSIERSSGIPSLDAAAEEMIERASPLPPIPAEMGQDRLEIVVPVAFLLR